MNKKHVSFALLVLLTPTIFANPPSVPSLNTSIGPAQTKTPPINCQYHIEATTTMVDPTIISTWAEKAVIQSFEFSYLDVDTEIRALKDCYTDQGWQGFNDALKKSGNITAIKSQKLTVSSQKMGELKFTTLKENEWKVTVPLQVVYQNDKEKLTQLLSVTVLISRKVSGDLGIVQMLATPLQKK